MPGFQLENVLLLREPAQANAIATAAEGKKVVVIGTSFIGEWYAENANYYEWLLVASVLNLAGLIAVCVVCCRNGGGSVLVWQGG